MELKFDPNKPKYEYITSHSEAEKVFEKLKDEKMLAVDVEASSLDPFTGILFLVQIGTAHISYVFDARTVSLKDISLYKQIMEDNKVIKLLHNASFDYKYLKLHTGVELKNIYDTMLAEGILTSGMSSQRTSLIETVKRHLDDGIIEKDTQMSFTKMSPNERMTEDQLIYSAKDTLVLFPLFEIQSPKLKKENLINIAKLEFAVAPVVAEIELRGVYLNAEKWRDIIKNLQTKRDALAAEFQEAIRPYYSVSQSGLFGGQADSINMNSPVQLMELFNGKLGLNVPSTGSQILTTINHPVVNLLSQYRGYEKLISAFGDSVLEKINPKTGRIHPHFIQLQTATGRFACASPNIQQIPRNSEEAPFRTCFNPAEGYKLVVSDYSSFEMRILAELSGDEKMIHAIKDDLDIHSYTASLMFDKPYSDDFKKKYPDLRQMAKPIGFGLMYGMGPQGLVSSIRTQSGTDVTVEQSEDLINRYFKSYPSVKKFLDNQARNAVRLGYSTTPAGRKRWYQIPEKSDPDYRRKIGKIEREAKNHPIQGTNADAIKFALNFVHQRMKKDGIDGGIILTVHDEIACEVREDQAEDFAEVLSYEMRRAGELFLKTVPVKSDPFVGDVWEH